MYERQPVRNIIVVAGWPCKGTFQARDTSRGHGSRPGLEDPQSALFWEVPRILRALREAIRSQKPPDAKALVLRFIIENVVCDADSLQQVSKEIGVEPIMVDAARTCPATRKRLFWLNFTVRLEQGETWQKFQIKNSSKPVQALVMRKAPHRFEPDPGWRTHPSWDGQFPCVLGWMPQEKSPNPKYTMHHHKASAQAKQRWEDNRWAPNLAFCEDKYMMWKPAEDGAIIPGTARLLSRRDRVSAGFPGLLDRHRGLQAGQVRLFRGPDEAPQRHRQRHCPASSAQAGRRSHHLRQLRLPSTHVG